MDGLFEREEISQAGVYFLVGTNVESNKPKAYIGEAEDVGKRLKQQREKEFWVQAILFVSKDENLTKSHIRYLEGRLIEEAGKIGRFELENDQTSGAKLPEADREDMEVFLTRISQLLPVLGCDILVPLVKAEKSKALGASLTYPIKGLIATGQRTATGFVVFKGSEATLDLRPSAPPWVIQQREKYLADGTLAKLDGKFAFTKDTEFSSPSAAAAVVCGGHVNGLTAWRNADGKNLKQIEGAA
ncbi:MAG TPA: GIY-YIG nuclease family protein [Candidatus Angelobacter sp.]|nr:GIY-YIG nuclease family protein [Candidatus Angelobacter sp.]